MEIQKLYCQVREHFLCSFLGHFWLLVKIQEKNKWKSCCWVILLSDSLCVLKSPRHVQIFETPCTAACHDPLSLGILQTRILEWVAMLFTRESSEPRDQTQVFHISGRFFTKWTTKKAQEYWSGWPIPSPGEPVSPALQVNSSPAELAGKPNSL